MEDHPEVLGDGLGPIKQLAPSPAAQRILIVQDAVEVLPEHHGAGGFPEWLDKMCRTVRRVDDQDLPLVGLLNMEEIECPHLHSSSLRCSTRCHDDPAALRSRSGLQTETKLTQIVAVVVPHAAVAQRLGQRLSVHAVTVI